MVQDTKETNGRPAKRQRIYEDHRPMSFISEGIKQGRLHQVHVRQPVTIELMFTHLLAVSDASQDEVNHCL